VEYSRFVMIKWKLLKVFEAFKFKSKEVIDHPGREFLLMGLLASRSSLTVYINGFTFVCC